MIKVRALIVGGIGAFAFVAGAHAADPPGTWRPAPAYDKPEPRYRELLSGWYLRGDIGYRWNNVGSTSGSAPVTTQKYDNAVSGTLGFGYKYQWFRAEMTLDYGAPSKISATTTALSAQPQYTANVRAFSAMVNAYVDFGTWVGFTPYIGAGVGATQLKSVNYVDTSTPLVTLHEGSQSVNFSWAWMAGIAFQVQPNWMVDVGYRHLSLGNIPGYQGAGSTNNGALFKNLTAQEARLGIRFLFD